MRGAILCLQVPTTGEFITVAMTKNPTVLGCFKKAILARHRWFLGQAESQAERVIRGKELKHMQELLDLLIPDSPGDSDGSDGKTRHFD